MDRSKEYGYAVIRNMRTQRRLDTKWVNGVWKDDVRKSRLPYIIWAMTITLCAALMFA